MFGFCGAYVLVSNNQKNNHERKKSGLKHNLNPIITKGMNLPYFCKEISLMSHFCIIALCVTSTGMYCLD